MTEDFMISLIIGLIVIIFVLISIIRDKNKKIERIKKGIPEDDVFNRWPVFSSLINRDNKKKEWEEFKNMNPDIFEESTLLEMIDKFMTPDCISINKFTPNYMILKDGSKEIYSAFAKLRNEPDLSEDGTPTIEWMSNILNQPPVYPLWFMAGYPDVVKWFSDLDEGKMKLFIDDFINDRVNNNGKFKLPILRKIIDEYVKEGNTLECV
jgi:hypothetical protein